ncbi:MAG TPA: hypothetical protein VJ777_27050 [Mycobacterium sp.]|nr:hypothetical protein [Mycobacterium sp.]
MAREFGKIWFSMFTDTDFCAQPVTDKLLYIVLLAQPALNYAGVQPLNLRRWRKALVDGDRMPTETEVMESLTRLERRRYVFTDDETGETLARSFMRRDQVDKQPNVMLSALRAVAHVESPKLARVLLEELSRIALPTIAGTSDKAAKLRQSLGHARGHAMQHLERLSEGLPEVFPEPFSEELRGGISEGIAAPLREAFSPPAQTNGFPQALPEAFSAGSVVVEVGVETSRVVGGLVGEQPMPPHCPRHPGGTDAPCRACRDCREHHESWLASRAADARSARSRAEVVAKCAAIARCHLCDEDGYRRGLVCDHVDRTETARRGTQLVRDAMSTSRTA